jgi:hypothetical protein
MGAADDDPDEPRTGVFRRLSGDTKGSAANAFSAIEELFGPAKREARIEIEAQRRIGRRAPAPGDPPYLILPDDGGDRTDGDDVADGARFAGTVVIAQAGPHEAAALPPAAQPDGAAPPQEDRPVTDD